MDGFSFHLIIFLAATFAGALVAGLCGFAFGQRAVFQPVAVAILAMSAAWLVQWI